jgi:uncharacterized LabA/DUF88 family protein
MKNVNVYIDGFNLYHAIDALGDNRLKWINFRALGLSFLKPREHLNTVIYFTALLPWSREKQQRHKNFIAAQRALGVKVRAANFRKVSRHCRIMDRTCQRYEEKQTDVAFAMSVLTDAMRGDFDRAILVTADSDQIPLVRTIRNLFPEKTVTLAAPPGRGGDARELGSIVHSRSPITEGRLRGSMLPRNVVNAEGISIATMPSHYARAKG